MKKDTQKRIEEYKAKLPGVKERIAAIALMYVLAYLPWYLKERQAEKSEQKS